MPVPTEDEAIERIRGWAELQGVDSLRWQIIEKIIRETCRTVYEDLEEIQKDHETSLMCWQEHIKDLQAANEKLKQALEDQRGRHARAMSACEIARTAEVEKWMNKHGNLRATIERLDKWPWCHDCDGPLNGNSGTKVCGTCRGEVEYLPIEDVIRRVKCRIAREKGDRLRVELDVERNRNSALKAWREMREERDNLQRENTRLKDSERVADHEIAKLQKECERLRTRLAEAEELLEEAKGCFSFRSDVPLQSVSKRIDAFLNRNNESEDPK